MLDDGKRTEVVSLKLTEREFHALTKLAMLQDRKTADMAHFIVRTFMFGHLAPHSPECKVSDECL